MGLTFAQLFAIIIIMKLKNVLCIYICEHMNKHGMLIMRLTAITSIRKKTEHTYTVQKISQSSQQ